LERYAQHNYITINVWYFSSNNHFDIMCFLYFFIFFHLFYIYVLHSCIVRLFLPFITEILFSTYIGSSSLLISYIVDTFRLLGLIFSSFRACIIIQSTQLGIKYYDWSLNILMFVTEVCGYMTINLRNLRSMEELRISRGKFSGFYKPFSPKTISLSSLPCYRGINEMYYSTTKLPCYISTNKLWIS